MRQIGSKELLGKIFVPTICLSAAYLLAGHFIKIPHLLLFCILATIILVPMELTVILRASKAECGEYSLKSAFMGQEKVAAWQIVLIAFCFFGIAGLFSAFIAPLENQLFAGLRAAVLGKLPAGFDWIDYAYLKSFSKPVLVVTCVYYGIFNVLVGPITEELYFRGYLTSHYEKQNGFTPILVTVLFSLYHFWLPFNNIFRILAFAPMAYVSYRKKNIYISMLFHCLCNLFSVISFTLEVLG